MRFSLSILNKLKADGTIRGFVESCSANSSIPSKKDAGVRRIRDVLDRLHVLYEEEYEFALRIGRKLRADFALHTLGVLIEYEGLGRGKSRHTQKAGYEADAAKYNLAQQLGWKVYRYTWNTLDKLEEDLTQIINNR